MLSKEEQLIQLLESHKQILLLTKDEISGDLFGSLLAWGFFIGKRSKKTPALLLPRYKELKQLYHFLPDYEKTIEKVGGARDFILSFNTKRNDIRNVRWEKKNGNLNIYITPQKGSIDPRDFSFIPAKFHYDSVFVLGTEDFSKLGKTYEENSELFFELPIINVDTNPGNENYGQLNIINPLPSSLAELSADLMMKLDESLVKDEIAQCLLTALVEATDNLRSSRVTPHTFEIASLLMERGGDHQEILTALYETETLDSLKLWGELLKRLKEEEGFVWSYLNEEELEETNLPDLTMRRFFVRLRNYTALDNKKMVVLWRKGKELKVLVYKMNKDNKADQKIIEKLGGELINNEILYFSLEKENDLTFEEEMKKIKEKIE